MTPRRSVHVLALAAALSGVAALTLSGALAPQALAAGKKHVQVYTESARSGVYYAAMSTATSGGGVFEDIPFGTSPGELVCGSAWLRTQYPASGASGRFALWLLGGAGNESGSTYYSHLGNLGDWAQAHTCVEATSAHSTLRIQFYANPGSPTVDIDDIDVDESLASNGGFELGAGPWSAYPGTSSNYVDYAGDTAHSGTHWGATNTTGSGGGIYEDVPLTTSPGQLVCGSAWLRTEGNATGAAGTFVLWLLGGASNEAGSTYYSHLGNIGDWAQAQTCVEATTPHTSLRIQLYPNAGSPTVEIDDVDVDNSLVANGGFEKGAGPWAPFPGTNSNYIDSESQPGASQSAHSGTNYAATNTTTAGGGIYEDVPLSTSPGQVVCGSAWLRTQYPSTGASGSFVLWLLGGGGANDAGRVDYGSLGNVWTQEQTCVEATSSHSTLRVQFYPNVGSPTVEIDDVNAEQSLAVNGGFEYGSGPWGTYPNTYSSYDAYQTGEVTGPATPVSTRPHSTDLPRSRRRHALKIKLAFSWTWRYDTTWLERTKVGRLPGRTRLGLACAGRGCPHLRTPSAAGAQHVRRLFDALDGRRYRAGDVLRITLTARGYRPERIKVTFRYGELPVAKLRSR